MPIFQMQTPDGRKFEVEAPDIKSAAASVDEHADHPGLLRQALQPILDIPKNYSKDVNEGVDRMKRGAAQAGEGDIIKGAANMGLGGLEYVTAPINAPIHSLVGEPIANVTGSDTAGNLADLAASILLPIPKGMPRLSGGAAKTAEAPPKMLGVTLSEGQASRDLPAIQREQAAVRGVSGPPAQKAAQAFVDQQKAEVNAARDNVSRSFDPFGAKVAEGPQEAGGLVSDTVQKTAAARKADVDAAYREARSLPGEIKADTFTGMPQAIKKDLSLRDDPVIVDGKLTPHAAAMIDDLEQRVGALKIENRASATSAAVPAGADVRIAGVDLKGVEQMRKRLSAMRRDAFSSGNGADARAARAVLDAFDDKIDAAVNSGAFQGDPLAVKAWNTARSAYADYRKTFTAGKNDPVGRVVERIIGKGGNDPAIPNDVADFMYGSAGVNPSTLNVGVVNRLKGILGDRSPEWSAVKQALFSRLTEAGPGMTELGAGKVAQRLNRFLGSDGKEMANLVYSPAERDLMKRYSDLMRQLEVPQAGANWSNTAAFSGQGFKPSMTARALDAIGGKVGMAVGFVLGHGAGAMAGVPIGGEVAGAAAAKIAGMSGQAMEARKIARMMPVVGKVTNEFKAAASAAEASPTPRNIARLTLAAQNLSTNLKSINVAVSPDDILRAMQGPAPGPTPLDAQPERKSGAEKQQ